MSRIVFTGITTRTIANWAPALRELRSRGHDVRSLIFQNDNDTDSCSLAALGFETIGNFRVRAPLSQLPQDAAMSIAQAALSPVLSSKPDLILLTTCHAGPELALASLLKTTNGSPFVIGCQHGFVQNWNLYWSHFAFDKLMVFGRQFFELAPTHLSSRLLIGGLPKLDLLSAVHRVSFDQDARPILFAAQNLLSTRLRDLLFNLPARGGRPVHIRPHPGYRSAFSDIADQFVILDCEEPLESQFSRYSLLLTTGSTIALEALVSGIPAVVIPEQRGEQYEAAGIVASSMTAEEVCQLASQQQTPSGRARIARFLVAATGSVNADRTRIAADAIELVMSAEGHRAS